MKELSSPIFTALTVLALVTGGCPDTPTPIVCDSLPEDCDGRDNDCDGRIDEADSGGPLRRDCSNTCGAGVEECDNGVWVFCSAPPILDEICNGQDDNCDGMTDEGCVCIHGQSQSCGEAVGVCGQGVQHCQNGVWGDCQYPYDPDNLEEICNDGLDNDCDGHTDEACNCTPGHTQPCGIDEGECQAGEQTCGDDFVWIEECLGSVGPQTDICDGLDNNCDGEVDFVVASDFGWRGDHHEPNNECGDAANLYNSANENFVVEGGDTVSPSVSDSSDLTTYPNLYPPGDEDWYSVQTRETTDCWNPFGSDCAFRLTVQLWLVDRELVEGAVQDPDDWRLCVNLGGCTGGDSSYCTHMDDWFESESVFALSIVWGSACWSNDPRDVDIRVYSPSGAACGHYQLFVQFEYDETLECPG